MCFSIVRVGDYALPGDLRTGSGVYPRGTAIGLRDALRFFLPSPGFSQTKAKNDSQKNYGEVCSQIVPVDCAGWGESVERRLCRGYLPSGSAFRSMGESTAPASRAMRPPRGSHSKAASHAITSGFAFSP